MISTSPARVHFMDPLRGILMMLGVLLHAAQVFNPDFHWLIHSSDTTPVAAYLVSFIHVFRMPAFYIVSGFFTLLTLRKYGAVPFLKLRAEKILIPLIATAVTLNFIQAWILHSEFNPDRKPFDLGAYFLDGEWLSHLWFLGYLFAYVVVVYLGRKFFTRPRPESRGLLAAERVPTAVWILLMPLYYLALVTLGKVAPLIFFFRFGFSIYDFLYYFQFFAFGLLLALTPAFFVRFTRIQVLPLVLLFAVWFTLTYGSHPANETLAKIIEAYARLLIVWISCHVVFGLFKTFVDRPARWSAFASRASYTVYLFHHVLVIALGLLLIHAGVGGLAGFLILLATVLILTSCIHLFVIEKLPLMSFLFNGKRSRTE